MAEVNLLESFPKSKRVFNQEWRTDEHRKIARCFDKEFFDGDRAHGYGGYRYDGRWKKVAEKLKEIYNLTSESIVLDIGCGKGFLLHDLQNLIPGIKVIGLDVSEYAINNSLDGLKEYLIKNGKGEQEAETFEHRARELLAPSLIKGTAESLPWPDKSFDLVLSINTTHNLPLEQCKLALKEMKRVAKKNMFVQMDAYKTEEEKETMYLWNLTGLTIMSVDDWLNLFKEVGYDGDYYWTIFSQKESEIKSVLITGSSKGLGKNLALVFSEQGYHVILHGRNLSELEDVRMMLKNSSHCDLIAGDITSNLTREAIYEKAFERNVEILINNAGTTTFSPLEDTDENAIEKIINTNLLATINLTKKIYKLFLGRKKGKIIFINSLNGFNPGENSSIYCASKYGLKGFADSLRLEASKKGIRVINVYPGGMNTPGYKGSRLENCMNPFLVAKTIFETSINSNIQDIILKKTQ